MDIQVVLTVDDPKLGKRGQVVKVSSGFAQNFLFPQQKAKLATPANLKQFQEEKARHDKEEAEKLAAARELAKKIRETSLTIEAMAGEADKLFGAITAQDISSALFAKGLACDRKKIHLEEPIKKIGVYEIEIKLHPEVLTKVKVNLVRKG